MIAAMPPDARSEATTLGRVTLPGVGWMAAGLALFAFVGLLYLGRGLNFFYDEWTFATERRAWDLPTFLAPHNEHWSTVPVLVYKLLFATVGLRIYLPYLAVLELLHAVSALLLFWLVRRRSGDLLALVSMLLFLFLGRGAENIFWAFQIGFVGSVCFGLLAIVLLDEQGKSPAWVAAASAALVASLASSSMGLFFCLALAVDLALDRDRRTFLVALAAPALAYAAWFAFYGAPAVSHHHLGGTVGGVVTATPGSSAARRLLRVPSGLPHLPTFIPFGIGAALAGLVGLPSLWGAAALLITTALVTIGLYRRGRVPTRVVGALAALAGLFFVIGLGRSQFGDEQAAASRYVYVAAVFLILIVTDALADLPWGGARRWLLAACLLAGLVGSVVQLFDYRQQHLAAIQAQDAELQTVAFFRDAPNLDPNVVIDSNLIPQLTPRLYFATIDALGAPVTPVTAAGLGRLPTAQVDEAMLAIFYRSLTVAPAGPAHGTCQALAPGALTSVRVESGGSLTLSAGGGGSVSIYLSSFGKPPNEPTLTIPLLPGQPVTLRLPDTGGSVGWSVTVRAPVSGQLEICPIVV